VFPLPWSSKWNWSLHLFLGCPMFLRPFGLYNYPFLIYKFCNDKGRPTVRSEYLRFPVVIWCGLGSSVSIATDYGLDGPGIESRWGRGFPPVQTGSGAHPAYYKMGAGSFPGVKCGQCVLLTTHPLLAPRSWKSRAIPIPPSGPQPGLQRGYFAFYLFSGNVMRDTEICPEQSGNKIHCHITWNKFMDSRSTVFI
jgi:hypothetical protein